ncbi:MAG: GtrA family protein [Clostridia bacterium]|nr:GtrA family protein [Clostridia bacterium]
MVTKKDYLQMFKFLLFSISAGVIQIVSFTLLNEVFNLIYWPAYLISLLLSIVWNFTFNRKFTFNSAKNIPIAMLKVLCFYVVFTPLSTWWGNVLEKHINEYIVLGFTMIINFVTEFIFQKFFVFNDSKKEKDIFMEIMLNKD